LEQAEEILFIEMAEICLWRNKTDLSLLTNLTEEDIQKLQGVKVCKASEKNIFINDPSKAFAVLNNALNEGKLERRVGFVLDNAGFELFVDLILAGYRLYTGLATTVILHPKDIPWFVSDVIPKDFIDLLNAPQNATAFFQPASDSPSETTLSEEELGNLKFLFENWASLHAEGKLLIWPNHFWTTRGSYWRLPRAAPELYEDLKQSELVVFKGDLNYRRLIADASHPSSNGISMANTPQVEWEPTKPLSEAIEPLGPGSGPRILVLRTFKADAICGLPEGKDEELRQAKSGGPIPLKRWAWNGEWVVIQFSDGK
jgi:hypothetical protein